MSTTITTTTPSQSLEAKIVVLGAAGVGKTSLLTRFINGTFLPESSVPSTVGATFLTKRLTSPDDAATTLRLQIWDTAGQERFRSISKLYYRGANAALLCYDITNERSFDDMTRWLAELRENLGDDCVIHVVGTKADVVAEDPRRREVGFERCIKYVAEHLQQQQLLLQHCGTGSTTLASSITSTSSRGVYTAEKRHHTPLPPPQITQSHTLQSSSSTRSSGFWGQDTGWDCCHEISAKDGEGVDEVFRVIARKLVEQQQARAAAVAREISDGSGTWNNRRQFENNGAGDGRGSFRVGVGDKRRSWLGFPVGGINGAGGGSAYARSAVDAGGDEVGVRQGLGERQGRCC